MSFIVVTFLVRSTVVQPSLFGAVWPTRHKQSEEEKGSKTTCQDLTILKFSAFRFCIEKMHTNLGKFSGQKVAFRKGSENARKILRVRISLKNHSKNGHQNQSHELTAKIGRKLPVVLSCICKPQVLLPKFCDCKFRTVFWNTQVFKRKFSNLGLKKWNLSSSTPFTKSNHQT